MDLQTQIPRMVKFMMFTQVALYTLLRQLQIVFMALQIKTQAKFLMRSTIFQKLWIITIVLGE